MTNTAIVLKVVKEIVFKFLSLVVMYLGWKPKFIKKSSKSLLAAV